jgi:hypothetical protein
MKTKLLLSMVAGLMTLGAHPALAQRALGDSAVFATVPAVPGFPEGIAVRGNRVYVTGPANFGIFTPSTVTAYDLRTGALVDIFPVTLQHPQAMKGLSAGNFGPDGNHASLVNPTDPSLFAVFDVFVDDKGQPVP